MANWFDTVASDKPKIVVAHHPFILPPQSTKRGTVGRLEASLSVFSKCGVSLVLAGHLHQAHWAKLPTAENSKVKTLALQASTSTSTRLKGESNSYHTIRVFENEFDIHLRSWDGSRFVTTRQLQHEIVTTRS